MATSPVTPSGLSPATQDVTITSTQPPQAPRETPPGDSISSTTSNECCLVKIWNAICNFFKWLCPCLCGRSKQETKPEIIKPNIQKKPHISLTENTEQRTGNKAPEKPGDKTMGSAALPEAVSEYLKSTDSMRWFNSHTCGDTGRVQILLHLAKYESNFNRVVTYLLAWIELDNARRGQLKAALNVATVCLINQTRKQELITFLEPLALPEAVREFLTASDPQMWFHSKCDDRSRVQIVLHLANTGDINRLNTYLRDWVVIRNANSDVLKTQLGVRGIGLIEKGDDLSKVIDYFNGLLKNLL